MEDETPRSQAVLFPCTEYNLDNMKRRSPLASHIFSSMTPARGSAQAYIGPMHTPSISCMRQAAQNLQDLKLFRILLCKIYIMLDRRFLVDPGRDLPDSPIAIQCLSSLNFHRVLILPLSAIPAVLSVWFFVSYYLAWNCFEVVLSEDNYEETTVAAGSVCPAQKMICSKFLPAAGLQDSFQKVFRHLKSSTGVWDQLYKCSPVLKNSNFPMGERAQWKKWVRAVVSEHHRHRDTRVAENKPTQSVVHEGS